MNIKKRIAPPGFPGSDMIKVTIAVMSWLKEDFDHKSWDRLVFEEVISPRTSIMDLLYLVAKKYPKFGQKAFVDPKQDFFECCAVILNGSFLSALADLRTELKEGDNLKRCPGFYGDETRSQSEWNQNHRCGRIGGCWKGEVDFSILETGESRTPRPAGTALVAMRLTERRILINSSSLCYMWSLGHMECSHDFVIQSW